MLASYFFLGPTMPPPSFFILESPLSNSYDQGCRVGAEVGIVRSRRFLRGVGVGFLTTLGVGIFCPTPTSQVQLNHLLHHTPKLGIPVEMVISFEAFVETEISCCAPRFSLILTVKFHSVDVKEWDSKILERSELESDLPPTPQPWLRYRKFLLCRVRTFK